MSKESFKQWLEEQSYYVTQSDFNKAEEEHGVIVTLPDGITVAWDGHTRERIIPARDIRHGNWEVEE